MPWGGRSGTTRWMAGRVDGAGRVMSSPARTGSLLTGWWDGSVERSKWRVSRKTSSVGSRAHVRSCST
ncbi:hypothetical protein ACFFX0_17130 [Citricoccus parietis]|uniref:Uncharacterized protein n=1 Tax=Citricoccus parietis TaxID=592307 RepID=A0ABV5G1M4_9MICC